MRITVKLLVMPEPGQGVKKPCLLAKARQWVEDCANCPDDSHSWNMIRMLFNKLAALKKLSPKQKELMSIIEPTVEKFGQYDSRGVDLRPEHLTTVRGENPIEGANE